MVAWAAGVAGARVACTGGACAPAPASPDRAAGSAALAAARSGDGGSELIRTGRPLRALSRPPSMIRVWRGLFGLGGSTVGSIGTFDTSRLWVLPMR